MQESAKEVVTESADAIFRKSSSPIVPRAQPEKTPESHFVFTSNTKTDISHNLGKENSAEPSSSTISSTTPLPAVSSTMKPSRLLLPKGKAPDPLNISSANQKNVNGSFFNNQVALEPTNPGVGDTNASRSSSEREASLKRVLGGQSKASDGEAVLRQQNQTAQNLNNPLEIPAVPQHRGKAHTAPLYGNYKPHTIEYKRQLRSMTYDSSILDRFLGLQTESQAQAAIEKEQNLTYTPKHTPQTPQTAQTQHPSHSQNPTPSAPLPLDLT